jgi:hypothetical protein
VSLEIPSNQRLKLSSSMKLCNTKHFRMSGEIPIQRPRSSVINGERMPVTPNLSAGLQRLRYRKRNIPVRRRYSENDGSIYNNEPNQSGPIRLEKTGPRRIWIDAVCINQQDLRERSQQVSIMRDIYRSARDVVVWLGEDHSRAAEAIDFMKKNSRARADANGKISARLGRN